MKRLASLVLLVIVLTLLLPSTAQAKTTTDPNPWCMYNVARALAGLAFHVHEGVAWIVLTEGNFTDVAFALGADGTDASSVQNLSNYLKRNDAVHLNRLPNPDPDGPEIEQYVIDLEKAFPDNKFPCGPQDPLSWKTTPQWTVWIEGTDFSASIQKWIIPGLAGVLIFAVITVVLILVVRGKLRLT